MTKTLATAATDAPASTRDVPKIEASAVTLNQSGAAWQNYCIRLPVGLIADDLRDPQVFQKVQRGRNSLRKWDTLRLIAADESWYCEAVVAHADAAGALLSIGKVMEMPTSHGNLPQTEEYRIAWAGTGYVVERKRDGGRVSSPVHSLAMAERDMAAQYPRQV